MPGEFTIDGEALRVVGDLEIEDLTAFGSTTEQLIASTEGDILLDFSAVGFWGLLGTATTFGLLGASGDSHYFSMLAPSRPPSPSLTWQHMPLGKRCQRQKVVAVPGSPPEAPEPLVAGRVRDSLRSPDTDLFR